MQKLAAFRYALEALRLGQQLRHPAAWKNVQLLINLFVTLMGLLMALDVIPGDALIATSTILSAVANQFLTIATSKKVGIGPAAPLDSPALPLPEIPNVSVASSDAVAPTVQLRQPMQSEFTPQPQRPGHAQPDLPDGGWNDR